MSIRANPMDNGRTRASKLPRYGPSNVVINREGPKWMDGLPSLDLEQMPLLQEDIDEPHLSHGNLPPFYRQLSNTTAHALDRWSKRGNLSKEALGHYWPCDFNADGKLKKNRASWEIGKDEPPTRPIYLTHMSCGRPMKSMGLIAAKAVKAVSAEAASPKAASVTGMKRRAEDEAYESRERVILLHGSKDNDRMLQLQCQLEQRDAELRLANAKYAGLQAQMSQVESAVEVRSNLITNAIANYHFAHANLQLLSESVSKLADQSLSQDDIASVAAGVATLDYRVKVVKEIAERLNIPIDIERDLIGGDDTGPAPEGKET